MKNTISINHAEFQRFLNIHEQLFKQTHGFLSRIIDDKIFSNVPINSDVIFLGSRVNVINIGGLIRHLIIAEIHWIETIKKAKNNEIISIPKNTQILENITNGNSLIKKYDEMYKKGITILKTYTKEDLNKKIIFFNRQYTVLGFLWVLFGHHSYHLGQIDLLMRQNNINPPEYMEWTNDKTLIA